MINDINGPDEEALWHILYMCVYMCVYVCVCVCLCLCVCVCVCVCIFKYKYIFYDDVMYFMVWPRRKWWWYDCSLKKAQQYNV